jgi:hypothetical protein
MDESELCFVVGKDAIMTDPMTGESFEGKVTECSLNYEPPYVIIEWSDGLKVNYNPDKLMLEDDKVRVRK